MAFHTFVFSPLSTCRQKSDEQRKEIDISSLSGYKWIREQGLNRYRFSSISR